MRLDLYRFIIIIIIGVIAMYNAIIKDKEEKQGLPTEDEFSNLVKPRF
jgi:putative Mn2+ efflux pump MntP